MDFPSLRPAALAKFFLIIARRVPKIGAFVSPCARHYIYLTKFVSIPQSIACHMTADVRKVWLLSNIAVLTGKSQCGANPVTVLPHEWLRKTDGDPVQEQGVVRSRG